MLRLTLFEFLVRIIPEAFMLIFALFALCHVKINIKRYVISSIIFGIFEYGVRMLPINYGVNTILGIFVMIIIMDRINKADIILSIKSSLIITIGLFICEWFNVFILNIVFKDKLEAIMMDVVLKTVSGLPSLICFAIVTEIYYFKKGRHKCCEN